MPFSTIKCKNWTPYHVKISFYGIHNLIVLEKIYINRNKNLNTAIGSFKSPFFYTILLIWHILFVKCVEISLKWHNFQIYWPIFKTFVPIDIFLVPAFFYIKKFAIFYHLTSNCCILWPKMSLFLQKISVHKFQKFKILCRMDG